VLDVTVTRMGRKEEEGKERRGEEGKERRGREGEERR
jgi:hypothetical protein